MRTLRQRLDQIAGKGYKAYKRLAGSYDFGDFRLTFDHIQGDPYAQPSRISVFLKPPQHGIPVDFYRDRTRQTATEDFIGRRIAAAIAGHVRGGRGTGRSGAVEIATSGQQILRRNAVLIDENGLEARLLFALPGSGRSILADEAAVMLFQELPAVIEDSLLWTGKDLEDLQRHIHSLEDQQALRRQLKERGGIAFIADGAILPRRSGIDDKPLPTAVPFAAPEQLKTTLRIPHRGRVSGMLIPAGVTLIVGGGFHGKSTLLQALERGVYDHIPEDGRELVVSDPSAVKIRAEDHRAINRVDISPFINTLPGKRSTIFFSTDNASGSTSQAANIVEALECGCSCLLIDEDTSATNFMIRDERMQQLVPDEREPITPFLHRVRELYDEHGVSSVIVTGGSGAYLAVADQVVMLHDYRLSDVTAKARAICPRSDFSHPRRPPFQQGDARAIDLQLKPLPRQREAKIQVREQRLLDYGRNRIDLSDVEQLIDSGQTETIGRMLSWCHRHEIPQDEGFVKMLADLLDDVEQKGPDFLLPWKAGHLALPRLYELAAAANRLRPKQKS